MRGVVVQNGEITLADDLEVRPPRPHEVRIKVLASGICGGDLLLLKAPVPTPMVMGHEASGTVLEVGSEVEGIEVGQLVAVSCQRPCLRCPACAKGLYSACLSSMLDPEPLFQWRGRPVQSVARVSSLASEITVDAFQVHPVSSLEPAAAALLGCAVSTGYGTVRNVAKLATGESVVVVGVGGIGVNSLQTARLVGASRVIAVDVNPDKAELAHRFGADRFIAVDPGWSAEELAAHLVAEVGQVDVVVECTGQPTVMAAAVGILGLGGRLALVGMLPSAPVMNLDIMTVMAKHITVAGAYNGGCDPFVDMPNIVQLAEQGRLELASQVSHRFPFEETETAIRTLQEGKALRVVVEMSSTNGSE